jgi:NTP pyrophosphatase (non-canonical NTP hydrolase)
VKLDRIAAQMDAFVARKGWYQSPSAKPQLPRNLAISLVLEASEVLECFQWSDHADHEAVGAELADVLLYAVQLAQALGIDLENAVSSKLAVNERRIWPDPERRP